MRIINNFIYVEFYIGFNTVQVISRWVVLWAEETSTHSFFALPTFPHKVQGLNRQPQRWETGVATEATLSVTLDFSSDLKILPQQLSIAHGQHDEIMIFIGDKLQKVTAPGSFK